MASMAVRRPEKGNCKFEFSELDVMAFGSDLYAPGRWKNINHRSGNFSTFAGLPVELPVPAYE
jgi:hypothetical protein